MSFSPYIRSLVLAYENPWTKLPQPSNKLISHQNKAWNMVHASMQMQMLQGMQGPWQALLHSGICHLIIEMQHMHELQFECCSLQALWHETTRRGGVGWTRVVNSSILPPCAVRRSYIPCLSFYGIPCSDAMVINQYGHGNVMLCMGLLITLRIGIVVSSIYLLSRNSELGVTSIHTQAYTHNIPRRH